MNKISLFDTHAHYNSKVLDKLDEIIELCGDISVGSNIIKKQQKNH